MTAMSYILRDEPSQGMIFASLCNIPIKPVVILTFTMDTYVARQPIFNRDKKIFGYELLFREGMSNLFPDIEGDIATSRVLSSGFLLMGSEKITGGRRAFINFSQDLLVNKIPLMFPREKTVVEIIEDVEPEMDVINACREMVDKGYCLALDDFVFRQYVPKFISDKSNLVL